MLPVGTGYCIDRVWERDFHIDFLDLKKWPDFNHYLGCVSNNIRRDVKKAVSKEAKVTIRRGWAALRDLSTLITVRSYVMRQNGKQFSAVLDFVKHLVKILLLGRQAFVATVSMNSKKYAAHFCVEFGDMCFHIAGGVLPNDSGLGSFIMTDLIKRWWAMHPRGRFVFGAVRGQASPNEYQEGVLLYRRKLRTSAGRGSEFKFNVTTCPKAESTSSHVAPSD